MTARPRVPGDSDASEVARLMSIGWPEAVNEHDVRHAWSAPGFDRALDARLEPGAYAAIDAIDDGRVWINLRGRPSTALVDWAEQRALERGGRVVSGSWVANDEVLNELRRRGYVSIRHSFRMSIELADPPPAPVWPEGIRPRTFREEDARTFYEAGNEAFADTWEPIVPSFEEWSHWVLDTTSFDPELWFLAEEGSEAAGFAICRVHQSDPELGWVQILGVRPSWRGRGVGRALLLAAFGAFRARGLVRAGLGVDAENPTGATRLYESVGMRASDRFELLEKRHA